VESDAGSSFGTGPVSLDSIKMKGGMMSTSPHDVYAWTSDVLAALRRSLDDHGFAEILPVILSERYEPGARHSIAVLGDRALPEISVEPGSNGNRRVTVTGAEYYYLPVSHCVEKQLALEHAERVYCMAPCLRLLMDGEDCSGRHLYTFFQAEVEWRTESLEEVYGMVESLLVRFTELLLGRLQGSDRLNDAVDDRLRRLTDTPYERIPFSQARQRVANAGGAVNPHASADLTHAEERALSIAASAPFWLTDYPEGARDSLYRRDPAGTYATYDLILPQGHGELSTGGLRPDSADDILRQAGRLARSPHRYYADWKARTRLQTGGLGFGVERLIRYCVGAESVLDLRFAHDQGPNAHIGELMPTWT
jgi:asparaginyl-tRNA synthetase